MLQGYAIQAKERGATYQRLVNQMFRKQIGWNMEVMSMICSSRVNRRKPFGRPQGNLQNVKAIQDEAKPNEMCVWGFLRKILWLHGVPTRN